MIKIVVIAIFVWSLLFTLITFRALWNARKEQENEEEGKTWHSR